VCLGSLCCCMTQFRRSFTCETDGLTFDSIILYVYRAVDGQCALVLWLQNKTKSSPVHAWESVGVMLKCCICCIWFSSNVALCIMAKHLHFGLVCPNNIVLWFVQMQLCKPIRGFLMITLPKKPYLFSFLLIVLSWTLTFNMLTEACRVWDEALGFFAVPLSSARSDLGEI